MITDEDKERVRQATDILQLVGETVELRRRGADFWGCCPFHHEKSPSFHVNPSTGLWKSTYVMVTLDNHTCNTQTLNTVWVDSTLCKPLSIRNLLSFSIKHLNKVTTNNLALLLWVGNTFQILKELLRCINADNEGQHVADAVH